ncbi:MAG: Septum formation initiator [Gemmatimonadetes bacterium]|jgi:cell division protein FtsB|nr:Septum formation initiator [Gemmatimonadota bacterium]
MAGARKSSSGVGRSGASAAKRLLIAAGVLGAVVFAVQGGEYGTRDLLRQRARRATLVSAIDSLQRVVDSLKRYKRRLDTDPALQERIAREEFGLVRGEKELLYRFAEPGEDSVKRGP